MLKTTIDRFDLETQIMDCWSIINDIDLVFHAELTDCDKTSNALLGLSSIGELKFKKLWKTYEELVHQGAFK